LRLDLGLFRLLGSVVKESRAVALRDDESTPHDQSVLVPSTSPIEKLRLNAAFQTNRIDAGNRLPAVAPPARP